MNTSKSIKNIFKLFKYTLATSGLSFLLYNLNNRTNIYQIKIAYSSRRDLLSDNEPKREFFESLDNQQMIAKYPNLHILDTKTVQQLIGHIRDKTISTEEFRNISKRLIRIILEETFALECIEEVIKESPLGYYKTFKNPRKYNEYIAISILRSGNSMTDEILNLAPGILIGNVMIQRDETTEQKLPIFFFEKIPSNLENKKIIVMDPMLATGGSACATIDILIRRGVKSSDIVFVNVISCEEGLKNLFNRFPGIKVVSAAVDPYLLPNKYIAPGIGDFGDRFYGTSH